MTIQEQAEALGEWYHPIALTPTYTTRSYMLKQYPSFGAVWNQIRKVRAGINYRGANVIDIGTMDGMWAFEAVGLGATKVIASDIWRNKRLEFAITKLHMSNRVLMDPEFDVEQTDPLSRLDVVQFLGVLYHLKNPFAALDRIHTYTKRVMLLETACLLSDSIEPIMRLNTSPQFYQDNSTYWFPTRSCLLYMLSMAGFRVDLNSISVLPEEKTERVCLLCYPQ